MHCAIVFLEYFLSKTQIVENHISIQRIKSRLILSTWVASPKRSPRTLPFLFAAQPERKKRAPVHPWRGLRRHHDYRVEPRPAVFGTTSR